MSEITTLLDGWEEKPLGAICKIVSGGTPSRDEPSYWIDGDVPWVTPTDITGNAGRLLFKAKECLTPKGLRASSAKMVPEGTLLMTSRATLGEMKIAAVEVCTNQGFKCLVPEKNIDNWYLYYQMTRLKAKYSRLGIGSTFLEVNKKDTEVFTVPIAPLPEQRKIAKILSTVDNLIEKTQTQIDKYQSIKQGMMHDLFTRGVDEHGQLRPSYEEAPSLYKASELGWIPKEWEVSKLKDSLGLVIDNRGKTPPYSEDGIFELIETASISHMVKYPDYSRVTKYVDEHTYYEWFRGHPEKDDVLISTVGEYAGSTAYMETSRGTIAQNLIALRFVPSHSSLYIFYWTKTDGFRRQIHNVMMNAAQPSLKVPHLLATKFPVPKLQEQHVIANRIDSVNNHLNSSVSEISKYVSLKAGLMQDLLTGRVRVKVDA